MNTKGTVFVFQRASWKRYCATRWREQVWTLIDNGLAIFYWFVLSMRMQVILDKLNSSLELLARTSWKHQSRRHTRKISEELKKDTSVDLEYAMLRIQTQFQRINGRKMFWHGPMWTKERSFSLILQTKQLRLNTSGGTKTRKHSGCYESGFVGYLYFHSLPDCSATRFLFTY